ncbi:DUF317 domain-containing protein [Streptomyces sp. NPDC059155]|uniref:DUF317 domain-containing protein n=1 Tax=Streptomyces sp. NPDC059155 TaxID=3346745 RepID=UPI0036B90392
MWHATATATTPVEIMRTLLDSLTSEDLWGSHPTLVTEKVVTEATRPLADAGWTHTINGHGITLTAPGPHSAGVRFDPLAAHPHPTWTLWKGDLNRPDWTIQLSPYTPAALLQNLTFELAHGEGVRISAGSARTVQPNVRTPIPIPVQKSANAPRRW